MKPLSLTAAERRALEVVADCSVPVDSGRRSQVSPHSVHGATARRLEKRKLLKGGAYLAWGDRPLQGADLVKFLGHWQTKYTITRKGIKAIGWEVNKS